MPEPASPTLPEPSAPDEPPGRLRGLLADVVEAVRGSRRDFTTEPLGKALFLLAVPMVLETSMHSVFAICDTYFVGKLGAAAVASVGVTESLMAIVIAIGLGLSMGTAATVARRVGEKNLEGAAVASVQAIVLGLIFAVVLGLAGGLNAERLLRLMGAGDDILAAGTGYATWTFASSGTVLMLFLVNASFRGAGDPALALRALALANFINIALDPLLIFGIGPFPELGVTGAAVATTIGRSLGVLYQIHLLTREGRVRIGRCHLQVVPAVMTRLVRVSGFGILQFLVSTSSFTGMVRIITPYSSDALAAYTIAVRVIIFVLLPVWGLCNAAATLVGQNLGARLPERAEHSVWVAIRFNLAFFAVAAIVFFTTSTAIIAVFSPDGEVIRYGADCLRMFSFGFPAMAFGMALAAAFNGAGDTMTPMWVNLGCHWVLKLPLAWYLTWQLEWGPVGVFTAIPIAEVALAATIIVLFRRGSWKNRVL